MKNTIKNIGNKIIHLFGDSINDFETGELLGKCLLIVWCGKIHMIGYNGVPVRVFFLPHNNLRYWRCAIGFGKHKDVDFSRISTPIDT